MSIGNLPPGEQKKQSLEKSLLDLEYVLFDGSQTQRRTFYRMLCNSIDYSLSLPIIEKRFRDAFERLQNDTLLVCENCGKALEWENEETNLLIPHCSEKCKKELQEKRIREEIKSLNSRLVATTIAARENLESNSAKPLGNHPAECDSDQARIDLLLVPEIKARLEQASIALEMFHNDEYGNCKKCEDEMGERLELDPIAIVCVDCKTIAEKARKMRG